MSLLARGGAALALVLVATYYLLASIPFAYYHFLQFPHFAWMPVFIRLHPFVLAAALAVLLFTSRDAPASLKPWIRYVAIAGATAAGCMLVIGWAPASLSYELAAALSFVPLVLLAITSGIDFTAHRNRLVRAGGERRPAPGLIGAGVLAGTMTSIMFFLQAAQRGATTNLRPGEIVAAGLVSAIAHVAFFTLVAAAVALMRTVAARRGWTPWLEWVGVGACVAAILAVLVRRSLMTALILSDLRAALVSGLVSVAIVTFCLAALIRRRIESGAGPRRWLITAGSVLTLVACVAVLPPMLVLADWGATLQKLLVFTAWVAGAAFVATLPLGGRRAAFAGAICTAWLAILTTTSIAARGRVSDPSNEGRALDVGLAVGRYATFDTSLTVLLDVFRPVVSDDDFYTTLRRRGDATNDPTMAAVPLRVMDRLDAPPAQRPHIFIIVIDSLRPDYLSAYNPIVPFTPAIGAFANDSIVMRQAFTPYAGTALSQPALWAGGLIPRAMYVKPFSAVNNLERLLRAGTYRRYISVDLVLNTILEDWSGLTRLDAHVTHPEREDQMFKFDLCSTLTELTERLDRDANTGPVFFYSQPQSMHIRMLADFQAPQSRDERLHVGTTRFFKPAAVTLERMDRCFGGFIADLKARRMYDDSIIVLTSDHGDSYGEAGRWAHAFYMAPETMRIPLIAHVPKRLLQDRAWDPDAVALLTDVTPTLYDLVGYGPLLSGELLGRSFLPRVTDTGRMRTPEMFLVQSSYSRVFGLLDGRARWMYVADANHRREDLYDLTSGDPYGKPLDKADRLEYRKWLLDRVNRLDEFYGRADVN